MSIVEFLAAGLFLLFAAVFGALARRMAGGVIEQWIGAPTGTQTARMFQALMMGGLAAAAGAADFVPLGVILLTFIGATAGFPTGMVPRGARDVAGLALHGLMACGPLALGAWWIGLPWGWLVLAGLARAPAYDAAARWPLHWPALGLLRQDPPPTGEVLSGAALGVAIVLTVWRV